MDGDVVERVVEARERGGEAREGVVEARERFGGTGRPAGDRPAEFEILAITAGEGNGWQFSEQVLKDSLPLWEGVETFVDHAGWLSSGRSLRDLAGVCCRPSFAGDCRGVRLVLRAAGPSGALLEALGRDWLASGEPRPKIGFSADVVFTAKGREVRQILRVISLDLVFNPARGGAFVRALNQSQEGRKLTMEDEMTVQTSAPAGGIPEVAREEARKLFELRLAVCHTLLETRLAGSSLPEALKGRIRGQFQGRSYDAPELDQAIEDARGLLADLQGGTVVQGPRISQMLTSTERLQAAVDDLLEAPRDAGIESLSVEKLTGIRELYLMLTGDDDLHGGYYKDRVRLATTATMPALVKNAMNKILVQQWEELGRAGYNWWEKITSIQHFNNLNQIDGILVGEVGLLPEVAEGGAYGELPINDADEVGAWKKYGGYLPLTLELIDRDDVTRLRTYPRKLANAALRRISALVAEVFTATAGAGPVMNDGKSVFHVERENLGSAALTAAEWETASRAVYNQPMLTGGIGAKAKLAIDPRYLLVPRELRLTAWNILYPAWVRETNIVSENLQKGEAGDVVVVPEWTDTDNWAAVCDPRLAPAIILAERFGLKPEIFIAGDQLSPAMFTNDEVRLKIRHFLSVFVADYRGMFKANVG